jgi:uncharacterized membrane protein YsdA (DUF1294 family)
MVTFVAAFVLAAVLWWTFSLDLIPSWLMAITLVAFLAHGYDKAIAGSERTRVPEKVLLALTFAGGTLGTFLGTSLFHHKTRKASYRAQLRLVVGTQVILLILFFVWIGPKR